MKCSRLLVPEGTTPFTVAGGSGMMLFSGNLLYTCLKKIESDSGDVFSIGHCNVSTGR